MDCRHVEPGTRQPCSWIFRSVRLEWGNGSGSGYAQADCCPAKLIEAPGRPNHQSFWGFFAGLKSAVGVQYPYSQGPGPFGRGGSEKGLEAFWGGVFNLALGAGLGELSELGALGPQLTESLAPTGPSLSPIGPSFKGTHRPE